MGTLNGILNVNIPGDLLTYLLGYVVFLLLKPPMRITVVSALLVVRRNITIHILHLFLAGYSILISAFLMRHTFFLRNSLKKLITLVDP